MKMIKVYSSVMEWNNPKWEVVKQRLNRLLNSEDKFIVMLNESNDADYIQTSINTYEDVDEGLYVLETRIPIEDIDSGFKHYQLITNDLIRVINDFKRFFENKVIDTSDYDDVSDGLMA